MSVPSMKMTRKTDPFAPLRRVAAVSAILLVACGPRPTASSGDARPAVIPWIAARAGPEPTPSPTPVPTPLAIRYCASLDLSLRVGRTGAAAGTDYTTMVLTNRSSTPCQLQGIPIVRLLDAAGQPLAGSQDAPPWGDGGPVALTPGIRDGGGESAAAAGQAQITVAIASVLCLPRPATALVITFANGAGRLATAWSKNAYGGADCGGGIAVSPFLDAVPHAPAPEPPLDFTVRLALPVSVAVGRTLTYEVRLTNVSGHDILFVTCPGYTERIKGSSFLWARYALNCKPVGVFRSDETVTFAMEFPIVVSHPSDWVAPGSNGLFWILDHPFHTTGSGQITLTA